MFIMAGLDARGLHSKLLITPLSECSHNIIILQVWCSLKSVTTTLCLLFSWLHILHCTVYSWEPSINPKLLLSCVYDTMIMQFYY